MYLKAINNITIRNTLKSKYQNQFFYSRTGTVFNDETATLYKYQQPKNALRNLLHNLEFKKNYSNKFVL